MTLFAGMVFAVMPGFVVVSLFMTAVLVIVPGVVVLVMAAF